MFLIFSTNLSIPSHPTKIHLYTPLLFSTPTKKRNKTNTMSSSTCISSKSPIPDSESRFSRPMDSGGRSGGCDGGVRVVDSKSCRQMYLRTAYTFSREEDRENTYKGIDKAKKCLARVREMVIRLVYDRDYEISLKLMRKDANSTKSLKILSKVKQISHAALLSMIRRMLACTAKIDVAEH